MHDAVVEGFLFNRVANRAAAQAMVDWFRGAPVADATRNVRRNVLWYLGWFSSTSAADDRIREEIVATLAFVVRDPSVGLEAIDTLGTIGPAAVAAIPALCNEYLRPDRAVFASRALQRITLALDARNWGCGGTSD